MEPIRILNLFTNMNRGGAESMVMAHYRAMDRSRVQFDFLVHRAERGAFEDEIESLGGRIFRMPPINFKNMGAYQKKLALFFADHPAYQIIHGHMSELGYFAYKAAREHGVPIRMIHAHNYPLKLDLKSVPRWLLKNLCENEVTHRFACSQKAGEWLYRRRFHPQVIQMRNAIHTRSFAFDAQKRDAMRAELAVEGAFVIGHVGRFDRQKNHTFLIDLFAAVLKKEPNARLLLAGDGVLRPEIEQKVDALEIREQVKFLGVRSDIADLLQAVDLFLFPSLFEGLPVTVVEAQAAGLPVLLADTISKEADIGGNVTFLSLDEDVECWRDEILKHHGANRLPDAQARVCDAGYDVETNVLWLAQFYFNELKKSGEIA